HPGAKEKQQRERVEGQPPPTWEHRGRHRLHLIQPGPRGSRHQRPSLALLVGGPSVTPQPLNPSVTYLEPRFLFDTEARQSVQAPGPDTVFLLDQATTLPDSTTRVSRLGERRAPLDPRPRGGLGGERHHRAGSPRPRLQPGQRRDPRP